MVSFDGVPFHAYTLIMDVFLVMNRVLYSYLKPESVRLHPEATVRPWATCQVIGDALSFAAALGYKSVFTVCKCYLLRLISIDSRKNQIYRKGYVFRRGTLVIQMFQQEQVHNFQPSLLHLYN